MLCQYVSQDTTASYCAALTRFQLYQLLPWYALRALHHLHLDSDIHTIFIISLSGCSPVVPSRGEAPQKAVRIHADTCHMSTMGQDAPEAPAGHPFQRRPQQKPPQTAWRCALCFPASSRLRAHSQASTPAHGDLYLVALQVCHSLSIEEALGLLLILRLLQSTSKNDDESIKGCCLPHMFCQAREVSMLPRKGAVGVVRELLSSPSDPPWSA